MPEPLALMATPYGATLRALAALAGAALLALLPPAAAAADKHGKPAAASAPAGEAAPAAEPAKPPAPPPKPAAPPAPKRLMLSVQVHGGASAAPIAGARVFVRDEAGRELAQGRTNQLGTAQLDGVPAGRVKLQITATSAWLPQGLVVDVGALPAPATVKLVLQPSAPAGEGK